MKVSFQIGTLRKATGQEKSMFKKTFSGGDWEFENIMTGKKEYPATHRISFELSSFDENGILMLQKFATENAVDTKTQSGIQRWIEAINNPKDAPVPSVRAMKEMLISVMQDNKYKWLMRESEDGFILPYLVTSISYSPPTKYCSENTSIHLTAATYYSSAEFSGEDKAEKDNQSENFFFGSLLETNEPENDDSEMDIDNLYNLDEVDDIDDDDEDEVRTKKKKKPARVSYQKRTYKKLLQILADKNLFLPTEESLSTFFEHARLGYELSSKMGQQFTCEGKAYLKEKYGYSRAMTMSEDGNPYRLVIDMKGIPEGAERQMKAYTGNGLIPYHPYIRCYNLTKYSFCDVHAALLRPYQYNDAIINNMIVDDNLKDYLNMILGGNNVFVDIVKGKSGGMIVLASGIAGVGKTLTAEVYSEKMHLPLYQIQAAQLGIEVEKIETHLVDALKRTERWGAVLLIDECDTYLRKRKEDLEQNAIVGIWLRLLEYFSGIMFLTTNMHDEIDDAILSRCSSHIKYEAPKTEMLAEIIKVHCRLQSITVTDQEARTIAEKYPMTGRDVRNMLKNIKKCYHVESARITLKKEMIDKLKNYIPFINK